jgi:hypothetical protein
VLRFSDSQTLPITIRAHPVTGSEWIRNTQTASTAEVFESVAHMSA